MKNNRTIIAFFVLVCISLVFTTGCTNQKAQTTALATSGLTSVNVTEGLTTVTITDLMNRTIVVPLNPSRIIGVGAGSVRMISYLQSTNLIVGVDSMEKGPFNSSALGKGMPSGRDNPYSIAHPELGDKPFIGTNQVDNPELIVAQDPDLILATWRTGKDADALSEKTGTPIIALVSGDLGKNKPQFYQSFRIMGKILGKEERAESIIGFIEQTLQDLNQRTKNIPAGQRKKVYVAGISYFGAHGLLSTIPTYPPLQMVNGYNVATGTESDRQNLLSGQNIMIDKEKLLEWDPDIIFVDEASYAPVKEDLKDPVYQSLSAVKNNRIYGVMPYNWYANNYDTVLADAYFIGKTLYPDQFADIDPEKKADEIYTMLNGKPVYPEMKQMFGGFVPFSAITNKGPVS